MKTKVIKFWAAILPLLAMMLTTTAFAGDDEAIKSHVVDPNSQANLYRESIGEPKVTVWKGSAGASEMGSKVKSTYDSFLYSLTHNPMLKNHIFQPNQVTGFSGAAYADKARLQVNMERQIIETVSENMRLYGNDATTIFIGGGSPDGFGAVMYDTIEKLKIEGKIKNVLTLGMIGDTQVTYHLEGIAKPEPYDSIVKNQDIIFLMKTYDGNYELKEASASDYSKTVQIQIDLAQQKNCRTPRTIAIEGGKQAIEESIEYMFEAQHNVGQFELLLELGDEAGKPLKDKGFRAAREMALIARRYPGLVPSNLKIEVRDVNNPQHGAMTIDQFFNTDSGKALWQDYKNADQRLVTETAAFEKMSGLDDKDLGKAAQKAKVAYYKSLTNHQATIKAIGENYVERLTAEAQRLDAWYKNIPGDHPAKIEYSFQYEDRISKNWTMAAEGKKLLKLLSNCEGNWSVQE